ncbi:family 1 encapsulin nanocompartment shell protein [Peptoniphilus equinus]|uniref:Type 1 encapsulin shell protein n=1 Tax=Peptoniphilus equinus TaxID=3016343 RepID=A0ABY7QTK7_9FIRM|nr:family 1 encapsulin nanocompartment shell protein [Peptoniphilus equinus]WBW50109.1 family 1 encapsulin nanocompartment shell protein [Peptoniphilus equinus]
MDFLKRTAAPISKAAWSEIDEAATSVFKNILSGRRVLKVNGPKGLDYTVVDEGRLEEISPVKENEVCAGLYQVQRLVEARINFKLNEWELDNLHRGAKDIDLAPLEEACEKLALYEEESIYNGNKAAGIAGLIPSAGHKIKLGKDANGLLKAIGDAKYALMNAYVAMPYDLVVSKDVYDRLNTVYEGAHLMDTVQKLIGGQIIRSKVVTGAVMFPSKDEDLEFTVGQDFAIGYDNENGTELTLFATESFTLRVLDPDKIVAFTK